MALSDMKIRKTQPKPKPYKLAEAGGPFVLVKPKDTRLWQQKYRHLGKERLLSHSQYPDVTLAQALKLRDAAKKTLSESSDLSGQMRLERIEVETPVRNTFLLVAKEYLQMS